MCVYYLISQQACKISLKSNKRSPTFIRYSRVSIFIFITFFIIKLLVDKVCKRGDGIGGTETFLGTANDLEDCVDKVIAERKNYNGASFKDCNGASDCSGYKNCFAEFEMNGWDEKEDFESCLFAGKIFS